MSLKVSVNEYLGVEPLEVISAFREYMEEGAAVVFMLGEDVIGADMWVIEGLDVEYSEVDNKGHVRRAEVSLKLKEYIGDE